MSTETTQVLIDGEVQADLTPDLVSVEVQEDTERAGVFALRYATYPGSNGRWHLVDDDRLRTWRRITIETGFGNERATIFDGYITHTETSLDIGATGAHVELSGMDATAVMNLEERHVAWPSKKDHEIAAEIFRRYGLSYEVEDTVVAHDQKVSTIVQCDTDIRFLRRLAARNGFECRVNGATGYFRSPNLQEPPQKLLALHGGSDGNLASATVRVDATPATHTEIRQIDPITKQQQTKTLSKSPRRALGADSLDELRRNLPDGRVLVRGQIAASTTEMEARLRGLRQPAERFVTLTGQIDSRAYESVLRAGRLVTVAGLGEQHSGNYYVTRVEHHITRDDYRQTFQAHRNGTGLTGREKFDPGNALGALQAGGATRARRRRNRVLSAQSSTSSRSGGATR